MSKELYGQLETAQSMRSPKAVEGVTAKSVGLVLFPTYNPQHLRIF